jgi:hypothetical protein
VAGSIIVSGSLQEIRQKLEAMKATIQNRVVTGWRPLLSDENWLYVTAQDDRVCASICLPLDSQVFNCEELPSKFPNAVFVDATTIKMNTHRPRDEWCRCYSFWNDAAEVVTERLRSELEEAANTV